MARHDSTHGSTPNGATTKHAAAAPRRGSTSTPAAHGKTNDAPETQTQAKPPASDVRTLRILGILAARTDEQCFLSARAIQKLLAHPEAPDDKPIFTSLSSVRASILALRATGRHIIADQRRGYALISRPLPAETIARLVHIVKTCNTISGVQRNELIRALLALAGPTQRRTLAGDCTALANAADTTHVPDQLAVRSETPRELMRFAVDEGLPVSFELAAAPNEPPHSTRITMTPESISDAAGTLLVAGEVTASRLNPHAGLRGFRLDRMVNLTLVDRAGIVHFAGELTAN